MVTFTTGGSQERIDSIMPPVQLSSKLELAVNLKTAETIGIDEVIE